jgi:hypothetical protein
MVNITTSFVKRNKDTILKIQTMYQHGDKAGIVRNMMDMFECSNETIYRWYRSGIIKKRLNDMFELLDKVDDIELIDEPHYEKSKIGIWYRKRGLGATKITKDEILYARQNSLSAAAAARYLGISYNTFKKYSREYGILEDIKNQSGVGISNPRKYTKKPNGMDIEIWQAKLRRKELRDKHLHKYHDLNGDIAYGCALYIITIPKGEERMEYINKWGNLPIKIGISKDIVQRYSDMILDKTYVYSDEEKWAEWNGLAEVINIIPFYTTEECVKVESRIHTYIREHRINGMYNKDGNEVWELFEADFDKINEAIETYVTGWRTSKWNGDEMNNEYEDNGPKMCNPIEYKIIKMTSYESN